MRGECDCAECAAEKENVLRAFLRELGKGGEEGVFVKIINVIFGL